MDTATDTTLARGLLMPNLKPKPKLIPLLKLGTDTMAVLTTDTMVDTTDTTVKNYFRM